MINGAVIYVGKMHVKCCIYMHIYVYKTRAHILSHTHTHTNNTTAIPFEFSLDMHGSLTDKDV